MIFFCIYIKMSKIIPKFLELSYFKERTFVESFLEAIFITVPNCFILTSSHPSWALCLKHESVIFRLVSHCCREHGPRTGPQPTEASRWTMTCLSCFCWPGSLDRSSFRNRPETVRSPTPPPRKVMILTQLIYVVFATTSYIAVLPSTPFCGCDW